MKIAFILDERWDSALTHYAYGVLRSISDKHSTSLFCLENSYIDKQHKGRKFYIKRLRNKNPIKSLYGFKSLSKKLGEFNPDLVFTILGDATFFACLLKKALNFKLIRIFGENKRLKTPRECIDSVIIPADFLKDKIDEKRVGSIHIVKGFVDTDKFKFDKVGREKIRRLYGLSNNTKVFGSVGRLDEIKGYPVLIKAFSMLQSNVKLVIVGEEKSQKAEYLNNISSTYGLDNRVIVVSERRDDIVSIMSAFDIGVIASTGSETIARVMFEFMSIGLPIVTTDVGMLKEVSDSSFSIVCKPNDESSLYSAMKNILTLNRDKLKYNALNFSKNYSFFSFQKKIASIIDSFENT